ncbi:MAG: DUF3842 family protein [Treponema sp.]|jgi:NAD(P)-dependent dehydrogenase (short-subunit alcohol dehydrogenase family)|nr:DUF3842 family protein [Treponema sp.]
MKHKVIIIDGMGGGIGVQLIARLKELGDHIDIAALGTNAVATERMMKAGAHRGATGENAIRVCASQGDFILGPIGIVIINSMMGEITAAMAEAILKSPAQRILLPLQQDHFYLAGLEQVPLAKMTDKAVELFKERLHGIVPGPSKIV